MADVLLTDPPYGINYKVNARTRRNSVLLDGHGDMATGFSAAVAGDDKPFDPAPWLHIERAAIFGANHFASRLPGNGKWIVWDKHRESARDDHSDCEFIWTNVKGADRVHYQKWRGVVREGEENCSRSKKLHQNQKPVALLTYILQEIGATPDHLVSDPYMGSGSSGIAALRAGSNFVGCEIDTARFAVAHKRFVDEGWPVKVLP